MLYNIIRNHRYVVTVVRASGIGHATIAEAAASDDSNIAIQITDENDLFHFAYADETTALFASDNVLKIFYNPSSGMMEAKSIAQVLAYDLTMGIHRRPALSCNVPGLSVSSSTTALGIDGRTYQVVDATFNGLTGASGHITVSYLNLVHKIDVTVEMVGWRDCEAQAVIYNSALFDNGNNKPWTATILPLDRMEELLPNYRLNNIEDGGAHYNRNGIGSYGFSSLSSVSSNGAWIYSAKGVDKIGVIDITYMDSGNFKKGKAIVFPY